MMNADFHTGRFYTRATALTLVVCLYSFLFGYHLGFSSPSSSYIEVQGHISEARDDFAESLLNIGAMVGSLYAGFVADKFGRKGALLLTAIPLSLGALSIATWANFTGLVIGRLVSGIGVGAASVLVPLYIAEISSPSLRGRLGALNEVFITSGMLSVNIVGLHIIKNNSFWKTMMLLSLMPVAMVLFALLLAGVETPKWLLSKRGQVEAESSLRFLRGDQCNLKQEMIELKYHSQMEDQDVIRPWQMFSARARSILREPSNYHPLRIGVSLAFLQQWTGITAFVFYTQELYQGTTAGQKPTPEQSERGMRGAIIVATVQVVGTIISSSIMDRAGRKLLLVLSASGMSVMSLCMAFAYRVAAAQVVKVFLGMGYFLAFAIGLGPVTWVLFAEIFPFRTRSLLMSICTTTLWLSSFLVTLTFNKLRHWLSLPGTFAVYSVIAGITALFVHWNVPETKGRSLEEIERDLFATTEPGITKDPQEEAEDSDDQDEETGDSHKAFVLHTDEIGLRTA